MTKLLFRMLLLVFGFSSFCFSQDFSALWTSHFSYNKIVDVINGDNKIFAAGENAIFLYDDFSGEIKTITTVQGLSGQAITTIYYSSEYDYLIIGYETGLIEIYSETDATVLTIVDIVDKQNITPENKRINHFYENNGLVYISTDFGVSVYDLDRLEFGDTYFLGDGGAQIKVRQVTVLNNDIYAACLDNNGLKRADLDNPNLIDYLQWETSIPGNFMTANTLNNKVYAVRSNRDLLEIDGNSIIRCVKPPSSTQRCRCFGY